MRRPGFELSWKTKPLGNDAPHGQHFRGEIWACGWRAPGAAAGKPRLAVRCAGTGGRSPQWPATQRAPGPRFTHVPGGCSWPRPLSPRPCHRSRLPVRPSMGCEAAVPGLPHPSGGTRQGDRRHDGCPAAVPLDQDGLRRPLRPNPSSGHAQSGPSPAGRPPWASRLGRYVSPRSLPSPAQLSIGLR